MDFDFWLDEIARDYRRLRKAPPELRADKEVLLEAMKQSAQAIKFAAESLKADRRSFELRKVLEEEMKVTGCSMLLSFIKGVQGGVRSDFKEILKRLP